MEISHKAEVDRVREIVRRRVEADEGPTPLAKQIGLAPNNIRHFLEGKTPTGERWEALRRYAMPSYAGGAAPPAVTIDSSWLLAMKAMTAQAKLVAELAEKTREAQEPVIRFLEQLDAMYRQAPGGTGVPPSAGEAGDPALIPPVSREKLDATVRRQLAKDAEDERRDRQKAAG